MRTMTSLVNPELITLAALFWARAVMTAGPDATLRDGDLNQRAMPNLNQGDVDALASAVESMLEEDNALRAWCSACAFRPAAASRSTFPRTRPNETSRATGGHPARAGPRAALAPTLAADFHARTFAYAFSPPPSPAPSRCPRRPLPSARVTVERFLRADRGNVAKATKRLRDTLAWRRETRPETKMCGACLNRDLRSHYMQHCGWDKRGRALVYSDIGMARDKAPATNAEHCQQVLELLEPSLAPFPNDQYVWVVDFHKFGYADMNPSVAGACLGLFGRSYPERLAGMIFVGAPVLFNGLYRAVAAFADPVTVKKVRFVRSPDGKGGGKNWDKVMDEFFDAETKAWLETEMRENRARWKDVAKRKSWLAAAVSGDGNAHGWQDRCAADAAAGVEPAVKSGFEADARPADLNGFVRSARGHDIRGCASFLESEACARAARVARAGARGGRLTAGALTAAGDAVTAREEARRARRVYDDASDEEEEFFDAEEFSVCRVVE